MKLKLFTPLRTVTLCAVSMIALSGNAYAAKDLNKDEVNKMIELCKKGPRHSQIRNVEMKQERFQDFKTFKVLHI